MPRKLPVGYAAGPGYDATLRVNGRALRRYNSVWYAETRDSGLWRQTRQLNGQADVDDVLDLLHVERHPHGQPELSAATADDQPELFAAS